MTTAESLGYVKPTGTDLVSNGDDAISKNADICAEHYDHFNGKVIWKGAAKLADLNQYVVPGIYEVSSTLAASLLNAPRGAGAGSVEVIPNGGNGRTQIYRMNRGFDSPRVLERAGSDAGTGFGAWVPSTDLSEPLVSGENMNDLTTPGTYAARTAGVSSGITGIPLDVVGKPFVVDVKTSRTSTTAFRCVQELVLLPYASGERPRRFTRSFTESGEHCQWEEDIHAFKATAESPVGHRRELSQQASRLRRGGMLGTNGATPVALSFDHGFANFRDFVLPHLVRLGLPCSVAINTNTLGVGESAGVTYSHLQEWCLNHGIELSHHSRDHSDVASSSDVAALNDKILGTVPLLAAQCPECIADSYVMPGVSGTQYNGFNAGVPFKNWWEHPAGRIIADNFPIVTGSLSGQAVPMTGAPVFAIDRIGWDTASWATETRNRISALSGTGMGVNIFMHPSKIENGIPASSVVTMLEWLAAERDAGRIEVLTISGFAWSDTSSTRLNLAAEPQWTGDSVTVSVRPLMDYLQGGQFQLTATSSTDQAVTLTATSDQGGLAASVTQEVTGGGTARLNFSIPVSATSITLTTSPGVSSRSVKPV